ncbi:hypothetical protein JAAARDRAFT_38662 [Jaapia argillacea MUCL 33604]|uniref:Transmembrane protein 188 n=1 Tax=Jaapia argillacea MUCL 33604 TaxID=933084 RepID=A0A067PH01_9AGAM|nr:hypothetical protein JAAARDRAFT_38662 [Jaapia argillacea MUCL 33604]
MPPRTLLQPSKRSFNPPNEQSTYRNLLLFEERLKTNASTLNRRKSRYQLFLIQLLIIIAFLLCEVLLQTDFLSIPYRYTLSRVLPDIYGDASNVRLHPYFASGLLFVSVTTLMLFFASGTYTEKIGYANRYVPHANKALRSFNMYFNLRQPPLRSKLPFPLSNFFSLFPPSSPQASPISPRQPTRSQASPARSPSLPPTIPSIPPTSNPRGELIFSSRVDGRFREGYERYRAAFEKKREEKLRAEWEGTWKGRMWKKVEVVVPFLRRTPSSLSGSGVEGGGTASGSGTPRLSGSGMKGRGSPGLTTPSFSRRTSPDPDRGSDHGGSSSRRTSPTGRSGRGSRQGTPLRDSSQ